MDNLTRETVVFPDGDDGRLYISDDGKRLPSVTTVLNRKDDPGKDRAIQGWKNKHDGSEGNADHECLFPYSGWRGTLVHWNILRHFADGDLAGDEERDALANVEEHDGDYDYVFSTEEVHAEKQGRANRLPSRQEYYDQWASDGENPLTLTDIVWRDCHWAENAFMDLLPALDLAARGFTQSDCRTTETYVTRDVRTSRVIDVERYVKHDDPRYAGQFDLLFEHPDKGVVLADLKTSSGVYHKHRVQLVAYAEALDKQVDELLVIRLSPDARETHLSWSSNWRTPREEFWEEFCGLQEKVMKQVAWMEDETESVASQFDFGDVSDDVGEKA